MSIDFDTQIIPILTKSGCNAGACHGAAAGRGGFALSLYGGDPAADHKAIVEQFEGRRVNLARPAASLLIAKPTEVLSHGGGGRLEYEGDAAKLIESWIAQGAKRGGQRKLAEITVSPRRQVLDGTEQPVHLRATARFADSDEAVDVTRWTVFNAEDSAAVEIDDISSSAVIHRRGRHVIIARFLDRVVPLEILVPLADQPVDLSASPCHNFIDDFILGTLDTLRIPAAGQCDDATFLRRLRLDLTGRLPQPEEIESFLADTSPDKRGRLIDQLLASDEFTEYFTHQLARLLRIRPPGNDERAGVAFHGWLKKQIERGAPYDELARELLLAEGDSHAVGAANFYRLAPTARDQAEYVSETLMGVRLRCANCHNHPLDQWTQDDYHGLAAVFARLDRGPVVRRTNRGEVSHPRSGEPALPRIPGERFLDRDSDGRAALAGWLTADDNAWFARAIVNRLWKMLMGRGLIEPADDLRASNPATHEELLERLAADFREHGYDLRHTLRRIANSAAYARAATTNEHNATDDRFYSHALPRPLSAEVLADALADVTDVWEQYGEEPLGTRAISLFNPAVPSPSLDILGRCDRAASCETVAGETAGGLATKLHLINGPLVNAKIAAPQGRLRKLIEAGRSNQEIVAEFYLRALGRAPTKDEAAHWDEALKADDAEQRRQALEAFVGGAVAFWGGICLCIAIPRKQGGKNSLRKKAPDPFHAAIPACFRAGGCAASSSAVLGEGTSFYDASPAEPRPSGSGSARGRSLTVAVRLDDCFSRRPRVISARQLIRVGHSPDPDDAFMFHALANGKLDTGNLEFRHELVDIETLNHRAKRGELELTAVSIHAYAFLTDRYLLCPCGASMGDDYGPMVVARDALPLSNLKKMRIAVPGTLTSAYLALRLCLGGQFEHVVVPFDEIIAAVERGEHGGQPIDAGLIIHEGQLTYGDRGLSLVVDLGKWWKRETDLPLPLGANAIRKDLGPETIREVNRLLKASIQYALDHRREALDYALQYGRDLDRAKADRFVGMYVNDWTLDFGPRGREAVREFLRRGHAAGVIPHAVEAEFLS